MVLERGNKQQQEQIIDVTSLAYQNFINSIKSDKSRYAYSVVLKNYLKYNHVTIDTLLNLSIKDSEHLLINYIQKLRSLDKSHSFIGLVFTTVKYFYVMNDIRINKEKIGKFLGESGRKYSDRAYTHEEIKKILDVSDLRMKSIVLLMASTGMRVGAIPDLKLKHLQEIKKENIYKVIVYEKSKEQYYTFCSPECYSVIQSYLDFRQKSGEKLDNESYLIREQFDINDFEQIRKKSRKVALFTIRNTLQTVLRKAGITEINHNFNFGDRNPIPMSHGFRKFWMTQAVKSKMPAEQREMLLGHKIGLASAYYRPSEDDLLDAYLVAVDNLTINEENRLRKRVEKLEIEKTIIDQMRVQILELKEKIESNHES
jgi:integrase